ncbi:response regulator [Cohnella luojiensis]|uniref:Response regulator n=1 Tax=Cohnella luojiensis TaxID=652876 RepID=A0A4Y8M4Q5_9BACL|nr:response regulator [Cohnella luojiensis]TFE30646.1 response regulator [Cohnella luojiensis]
MYKVILIDDEDEVREGMKYKTQWAECGFELVGDFENGRDAWDAMESLKPDAVITDICMPFMDGLELTRRIFENCSEVKVVIVTGYEDFDYAKRAIKLKVNDYLLKPLNSQEFTSFLKRMKVELDEDRFRRDDLSRLQSQLHQSLPLLKEQFLEKLATGSMGQEEREFGMENYRLRLAGPAYVALIGDLDENQGDGPKLSDADRELHRFGVYNIMQEIIEKEHGGIVFRTREHKIAAFYSAPHDQLALQSQTLAKHVRHSVEKYLKRTISIGIGRPCEETRRLPQTFQEALSALDYRFMLGANQTLSIQDVEFGSAADVSVHDNDWEKRMVSAMRTGSKSCVSKALQTGFDDLRTSGTTADKGYGVIHKLLVALMNWISETGLNQESGIEDEVFAQIQAMKTLDAIQTRLEQECDRILTDLSAKRSNVTLTQMRQAEKFIQDNYMNEELSLNDVCNHLYMSISYFSTLFKQHTGVTFIEYVTRTRIEQAKQLLAVTSHKTYEIAQRVGYGDPHYFSVIFKRQTGTTPKEYRTLHKGIS